MLLHDSRGAARTDAARGAGPALRPGPLALGSRTRSTPASALAARGALARPAARPLRDRGRDRRRALPRPPTADDTDWSRIRHALRLPRPARRLAGHPRSTAPSRSRWRRARARARRDRRDRGARRLPAPALRPRRPAAPRGAPRRSRRRLRARARARPRARSSAPSSSAASPNCARPDHGALIRMSSRSVEVAAPAARRRRATTPTPQWTESKWKREGAHRHPIGPPGRPGDSRGGHLFAPRLEPGPGRCCSASRRSRSSPRSRAHAARCT